MPTLPHLVSSFLPLFGGTVMMGTMNSCKRSYLCRYMVLVFTNFFSLIPIFFIEYYQLADIPVLIIMSITSSIRYIVLFLHFHYCYHGNFSKIFLTWIITNFYIIATAVVSALPVLLILKYDTLAPQTWPEFWLFFVFFVPVNSLSLLLIRKFLKKLRAFTKPPFWFTYLILPFCIFLMILSDINAYFIPPSQVYFALFLCVAAVIIIFAIIAYVQKQKLTYTTNYLKQQELSNARYRKTLHSHLDEMAMMREQMIQQLEYLREHPLNADYPDIQEYAASLEKLILDLDEEIKTT